VPHPGGTSDAVHGGAHGGPPAPRDLDRDPVVVFWELTLACALSCRHCRAEARPQRHPNELSTAECFSVMDQLASFDTKPIVVLSGGDPFMRRDLFEIAEYGIGLGMIVSVSPSATALVTEERLKKLVDIGVRRVSFSLDGATAETHDSFRGFAGTFERTLGAFEKANAVGLQFQVNTTITSRTRNELTAMGDLVSVSGAALWDLFFLVPTGRGLESELLSADDHEDVYDWILDNARTWPFQVKTTLGQPYRRKMIQRRLKSEGRSIADLKPGEVARYWPTSPTNDGRGIFFISHTGDIYPSGFLPLKTGNARAESVVDLYRKSEIFTTLRDRSKLTGKCGGCMFNSVCGGSRSRTFALTGNLTAADPTCAFQPAAALASA